MFSADRGPFWRNFLWPMFGQTHPSCLYNTTTVGGAAGETPKNPNPLDERWLLNLSHPIRYAVQFKRQPKNKALFTSRIKDLGTIPIHSLYSWWLNQPIWKIFVKLDHFPKFRGEHKKCLSCHHLDSALDTHCTPKRQTLGMPCEELWKTFNGIYFETRKKVLKRCF